MTTMSPTPLRLPMESRATVARVRAAAERMGAGSSESFVSAAATASGRVVALTYDLHGALFRVLLPAQGRTVVLHAGSHRPAPRSVLVAMAARFGVSRVPRMAVEMFEHIADLARDEADD